MKTIGLIGGMSWESTVTYYQILNETVKKELGGFHSAKCILYSVDFDEIEKCQANNEWEKSGEILSKAAQSLEKAGADFILLCTNTMHKVADAIQSSIKVPLLHIAKATGQKLKESNISTVGLLGTKYTMKQDFYRKIIENDFNINVLIPDDEDCEKVNNIIFNELCLGTIKDESKGAFVEIVNKLKEKGAQAVILGCTEIGLLIHQNDTEMPLFDTTTIHAEFAVKRALSKE